MPGSILRRCWLTHLTGYVRWFDDLKLADLALVGGKNASLGELYGALKDANVRLPDGFAVTADAYRDALNEAGAWDALHRLLDGLDVTDVAALAVTARKARRVVYDATGGQKALRGQITAAYRRLQQEYGEDVRLAVRSSATAGDLPTASFAGQHESYLHVQGDEALIEACRNCFASIFTDRAIVYRVHNGFDHFKVFLSVGVMKMVRSDERASGVIFTLDTESGFRDVVFVTAAYGLGESIVQGKVDPDEFYVHKPTFRKGHRAVLRRSLGAKQTRLVYAKGRELGVPAVVGAGDATVKLLESAEVTVSCAEGETGKVYDGAVPFEVEKLDAAKLPGTRTQVMVNLAHPDLAFKTGMLPSAGVGLARMEFIFSNLIGLHPMAAAHPERVPKARDRAAIDRLANGYGSAREFFVNRLPP